MKQEFFLLRLPNIDDSPSILVLQQIFPFFEMNYCTQRDIIKSSRYVIAVSFYHSLRYIDTNIYGYIIIIRSHRRISSIANIEVDAENILCPTEKKESRKSTCFEIYSWVIDLRQRQGKICIHICIQYIHVHIGVQEEMYYR